MMFGLHTMQKIYGPNEITLTMNSGTNYAIVSQSGSGKTTLLKLIN